MIGDLIPLISFVVVTTFTPGPNNISSASMGVLHGYRKTLNFLFCRAEYPVACYVGSKM